MLKPSMKTARELLVDWQTASSLFATLMLLNTLYSYIPVEIRRFARKLLSRIFTCLKPSTVTIIIEDTDTFGDANDIYDSAQLYLGTHCLSDSLTVRLFKQRTGASQIASLPDSHTVHDIFQQVPMKWKSYKQERPESGSGTGRIRNRGGGDGIGHRSLKLVFHQKQRNLVFNTYIPHILKEAKKLRNKQRKRKLYTNRPCFLRDDRSSWSSHTFSHPSNFDTIALDPSLREEIRADLLRFVSRKDHYKQTGRAWKRGYLLHGPPGTGKTSLVAAIANLLKFDVYDLELTAVHTNSQLRQLLVSTTPKSIIVVEDIDCSLDLSDRKNRQMEEDKEEGLTGKPRNKSKPREELNLSGVLNFLDGLWSTCVGERLMIFTTNHPDRLDPALVRPGRMDKKIELGYCGAAAFRILVKNYLCLGEEEMDKKDTVAEIERLLGEVEVTPAEVAEVFMGCDGDSSDVALGKLVLELRQRELSAPPKLSSSGQMQRELQVVKHY